MICAKCQASVPDDSVFCLRCGTRLVVAERRVPVDGGKAAPPAGAVAAELLEPRPEAAAKPVPEGGKQAYALSFKALADERLRYRVARWVCEVAPAHALSEVQEDLMQGAFVTFLALTPADAETARQRIQALGAHPALWQLAPASTTAMLLPERPSRKVKPASQWSPQKRFAAVGVGILLLFIFGLFATYQYRQATSGGGMLRGPLPRAGASP